MSGNIIKSNIGTILPRCGKRKSKKFKEYSKLEARATHDAVMTVSDAVDTLAKAMTYCDRSYTTR